MKNYISVLEGIEGIKATNDGFTACASFLNQLFESSIRNWRFPPGTYIIEKTLRLTSDLSIQFDPGAKLILADGAATEPGDYLMTNADHEEGNQDIEIVGGVFDGNQIGNPRPSGLFDLGYTGTMLHFRNVKNLKVQNVLLKNAEAYYLRLTCVKEFEIENIHFDSDFIRPNNDGIHLGGNCSLGKIKNIFATRENVTGDDLIALNADDALDRTEVRGMTNGDISDICIENIQAHSCHTFIRLLCVSSVIRNVSISKVQGGFSQCAINADGARGCRVPLFDESDAAFFDGVGLLKDITIQDINVWRTSERSTAPIELQERMSNLQIRNFLFSIRDHSLTQNIVLRYRHVFVRNSFINGQEVFADTRSGNPAFEFIDNRIESAILSSL
ncbi:glycosyl hydrolase family 28 protein [Cerasicoccus frondis]|uniref:glycosyl hydrolase family 28 protein n=1 Tax=Cerasicoccus frondis TaxID=490090 RepID=UPI0028527A70|nr:glycosyl hydrolase family 28-related protein [Cerasicoccus frondis]